MLFVCVLHEYAYACMFVCLPMMCPCVLVCMSYCVVFSRCAFIFTHRCVCHSYFNIHKRTFFSLSSFSRKMKAKLTFSILFINMTNETISYFVDEWRIPRFCLHYHYSTFPYLHMKFVHFLVPFLPIIYFFD